MTRKTVPREVGIPFISELTRAVRDRIKTETMRLVNPQPDHVHRFVNSLDGIHTVGYFPWGFKDRAAAGPHGTKDVVLRCPYAPVGTKLWVKESIYIDDIHYQTGSIKERPEDIEDWQIYYRADGDCCQQIPECACAEVGKPRWRSSRFMPKWAARTWLEVTAWNIKRLHDTKPANVRAEGCSSRQQLRETWDRLHDVAGERWDDDPLVWWYQFKVIERPL